MKKIPYRLSLSRLSLLTLPVICLIGGLMASCNSKDDDDDDNAASSAISVAVTNFSINPNARVMANLDSVYFSIDLNRGVIFNADSLPMGTKVDKLVPVITYPSTVTKAVITMSGGQTREGTVDYKESPADSIDFTGNVTLTLTASDESLSKTYRIKVNVHKTVPDSLMWDKIAVSTLPSRAANPTEQRSVSFGKNVYTLIREADNSLTLASCQNPAECNWRKEAIDLPFTPQIRSFNAADDALYILSSNGSLYKSEDARNWTDTGITWKTIIGGFGDSILGLVADNATYLHDIYPRPGGFTPVATDPAFPIEGISNFNSYSSKWATLPIGFFCGGCRDGKTTGSTWAYDGSTWAEISNHPLPSLRGALIVPYFNYRKTTTSWIQTEYSVWLCIGGSLPDGSLNKTVYISYDNGVNWATAPQLLQLPKHISPGSEADAIIRNSPFNASLSAYWKSTQTPGTPSGVQRVDYFIDGDKIDWECPYIYLFGGINASGALSPDIRRAVLARLTYAPLF